MSTPMSKQHPAGARSRGVPSGADEPRDDMREAERPRINTAVIAGAQGICFAVGSSLEVPQGRDDPVAQLGLLLEERPVETPRRGTIAPVTPNVRRKVFGTRSPTPTQEDALRVALNTPGLNGAAPLRSRCSPASWLRMRTMPAGSLPPMTPAFTTRPDIRGTIELPAE